MHNKLLQEKRPSSPSGGPSPSEGRGGQTLDQTLRELEGVLRQQVEAHEQLLALMRQKRGALARGDAASVAQSCREENERVQRVAELEKRRLALAGELTLLVEPKAAAPLRLMELAEKLAEPARGRVLVLRQQVRERMEQVRQEIGTARLATESLVRHMQGLVQTIGGAVTGVATYNRAGARPQAALAVSTFHATA